MLIRILNSKMFIRIMVVANLFMLALLLYLHFSDYNATPPETSDGITKSYEPLKLTFTGNIQLTESQIKTSQSPNGTYHFSKPFQFISGIIKEDDYTFASLTSVFAGNIESPANDATVSMPDEFASTLKQAGFDFFFTANRNAWKFGDAGLTRTLQVLSDHSIMHTGTYSDFASARNITVVERKGIKLCMLSYVYITPEDPTITRTFRINQLKVESIRSDIQTARRNGVEIVIVHLDLDANVISSNDAKEMIKATMELGADIILVNQDGKLSDLSCFNSRNAFTDQGIIATSLGTFLETPLDSLYAGSAILSIEIQKDPVSQRISLRKIEVTPTATLEIENDQTKYLVYPTKKTDTSDHELIDSIIGTTQTEGLIKIYQNAEKSLNIFSTNDQNCGIEIKGITF